MLDYRVQTFLTLYEERNYRKTAEKLNMTQPGVTQHIHYLEKYYGTKLFCYDGRSLSATESADRLKRYFDSVRVAEAEVRNSLRPTDRVHLSLGATKTIGEFVIVPEIRKFLEREDHSLDLTVDNTEILLGLLERNKLDFAVIEGVFDKSKYGYHLFKKEAFVGVCGKDHPFANAVVSLEDVLREEIVVREPLSGTRNLLENAIKHRGFTLDSFKRCSSVSNFSVICDLLANRRAITFAYEPIFRCRDDLATFRVEDMQISGEFNFVYCNEEIARKKIAMMFP